MECGAALVDALGNRCPCCLLGLGLMTDDVSEPTHAPAADDAVEAHSPVLDTFGDYELLHEIAHGGMGVVFKARQRSLGRVVAVKMIRAGRLASAEEIERFRAEAEMAAHLQHPHIVAIYEVGEQGGQHFYSMEYVEGRCLADLIVTRPLPLRRAAAYVRTIADAVHYVLAHGILHRDLKTSNVLIDSLDQPRITDFGLAKRLPGSRDRTPSAPALGTPGYMAPEQAAGKARLVTTGADVYGLGAILYDVLTGRPPFIGDSTLGTLRQVIEQDPQGLRKLNPQVDHDLEIICLKCLEKDPARRYGSAAALAEDLDRWLQHKPIRARRVGPGRRALKWARRWPAVATLIATLSVATAAFVGQLAISPARVQEALTRMRIRAAEDYFADNPSIALAYLACALRDNPAKHVAAERLLAALSYRRF